MDPVSGDLSGVVGTHVDDFIHAGDQKFEKEVMAAISKKFTVGTNEEKNFKRMSNELAGWMPKTQPRSGPQQSRCFSLIGSELSVFYPPSHGSPCQGRVR